MTLRHQLLLAISGFAACSACGASSSHTVPEKPAEGLVEYLFDQVTPIPAFTWPSNVPIPNSGGWNTAVEYGANAMISPSTDHIRQAGTKSIHLSIDPLNPTPPAGQGNFRAEIYLPPFHKLIPVKTEQWIGWSYYYPTSPIDTTSDCTLHQLHVSTGSPAIGIFISYHEIFGANHLVVRVACGDVNNRTITDVNTGIYPEAGRWMDFVEHVIWDVQSGGDGLYELWIDGVQRARIVGGTTFDDPGDENSPTPYGGTPKFGIYKYPWENDAAVTASAHAGLTRMGVYVGPVRILTRSQGQWIGSDGYAQVAPRDE